MANISLRAYYREIEELISQGRMDEVIAHCRQILKFFPKDVTVYRLLAKGYLESQRYSDATDIFQRVLSVVPDDFVSHVGMSIIREDEGNMDAAIWHMERAFEVQPSNSAIRDELRRLFGKRDGVEPPKIRLTRGALARMYAHGNLYQQSIGELRAAVRSEPQRFDLQVLLASMYNMNGQKVEAAETCNQLIRKLPFCLEANRILAQILAESDRRADAQVYHQRVQVLDPYAAHADPATPDTEAIPDNMVTLVRLDWQPGQPGSALESSPDWASTLGIRLEEAGTGTDEVPEWLSQAKEEEQEMEDYSPEPEHDPDPDESAPDLPSGEPPFDTEDFPAPDPTSFEAEDDQEAEDLIPDWMKDAGWATPDEEEGQVAEAPAPQAFSPDEGEADLAAAEIPDWLQDIAPQEVREPQAEMETEDDEDMSGEIPSWLGSRPPGPTDSVVMWLENKPEEPEPPSTGPIDLPDDEALEEEVPDWLESVVGSIPAVGKAGQEGPADAMEGAPEIESGEHEEVELPDWLADAEAQEAAADQALPEETPAEEAAFEEAVFDFAAAAAAGGTAESAPPPEQPKASIEDTQPRKIEVSEAEDTPLEEMPAADPEDTLVSRSAATKQLGGEGAMADVPAWMRELSPEPEAAEDEPEPVEEDDEALPDWLLEMERDTPSVYTPPAEGADTIPPAEELPEPEPVEDEELPAWLRGMQPEAPEPRRPDAPVFDEEQEAPVVSEEELPDWLAEASPEPQAPDAQVEPSITYPPEDEPEAVAPAAPLPNLEDQDAAIAWLESLAAKQGVAEEELITSPEERPESPPEWVTDSMSGEEIAEWTADQEDLLVEPAPELEEAELEPVREVPDWLTDADVTDTPVGETPPVAEEQLEPEPAEWSLETKEPAMGQFEPSADEPEAIEEAPVEEVEEIEQPPARQPAQTRDLSAEWMFETALPSEFFEELPQEPEAAAEEVSEISSEWMFETALPDEELELEEEEAPDPSAFESMIDAEIEPEAFETLESEAEVESEFPAPEPEVTEPEPPAWVLEADEEPELPQPATTRELDPDWMLETALPGHEAAEPVVAEQPSLDEAEVEPVSDEAPTEEIPMEAIQAAVAHTPEAPAEEAPPAPEPEAEAVPEVAVPEPRPDPALRYREALELAQHSLSEGDLPAALKSYNGLIRGRRHLDQVIEDLRNALYRFPVDTNILESLGDAYAKSDRLQEALDTYTRAEELLR